MKSAMAVLLLIVGAAFAAAQELPPEESLLPEDYDPQEFPQWVRDIRRFEVITIGSFPITFFATSLIYDFSLYAANNWDSEYDFGTQRDQADIGIITGTAAGLSLAIGLTDFIIGLIKEKDAGTSEQRSDPGTAP